MKLTKGREQLSDELLQNKNPWFSTTENQEKGSLTKKNVWGLRVEKSTSQYLEIQHQGKKYKGPF